LNRTLTIHKDKTLNYDIAKLSQLTSMCMQILQKINMMNITHNLQI